MKEIKVIVVPELDEFQKSTTYLEEIYITRKLGIPKLDFHNAKYTAPFWLNKRPKGVSRIYHIKNVYIKNDCTVLELGNSFKLDKSWNNMGNPRKFEYHKLSDFGLKEITAGLLF